MTPGRVTAKTLLQCRSLWLWHFFGLTVCLPPVLLPLFNPDFRPGALLGLMIPPVWGGVMAASLAKDFFSKPFSFCLPAHHAAWRRTLFIIGLVVSGLSAIVFLLIQTGDPTVVVVRVWQVFWLSFLLYSAAVFGITASSNASAVPALITLMVIFSFNETLGARVRGPFEELMLSNPVLGTVVCVSLLVFIWRRVGSRNRLRGLAGEPFLPLYGVWSDERRTVFASEKKMRSLRKTPGTLMNAADRFFLARMSEDSGGFTRRALWGTMYVLAGRAAPAKVRYAVLGTLGLVLLTLLLGFYHPRRFPDGVSVANLSLYLIMAISSDYRINPHASLMLNISRRNRFRSLMLAGFAQLAATAVVCGFLILVSRAAGMYLGEVDFLGRTMTFDPVIPRAFFLFAPMLPVFFVCQLLFRRYVMFPVMIVSMVSVIVFAAHAEALLALSAVELAALQVASWLPFVYLVRHYCYSLDIRLNGR